MDDGNAVFDHDGPISERGQRLAAYARVQAERAAPASFSQFSRGVVPANLDGYELLKEVRRGAQGSVYEAIQRSTKRRVAIKFMHTHSAMDARTQSRFEREIEILAQLRHPNVVTVHEGGTTDDGKPFLVMDFIAGDPLDEYMVGKKFSAPEILTLFVRIAHAVNAAHVRGVVHRDLKPSNILVDTAGEPHILDFGLAKTLGRESSDSAGDMTVTGQFLGSLPWSSPEQAAGAHDLVDIRSDVYALGVMLFHALTDEFPYEVTVAMRDVLQSIAHSEPPRPSTLRSELNDDVDTIVLRCLSKNPERRYQSAGELARDIERYLNHEPIEAKRDSGLYVLSKLVRRHRLAFGIGVTVLTLIATSLAVISTLYVRSISAEHRERARREQVQTIANAFIQDFDAQLRKGSTTARAFYVRTALEYLDTLMTESPHDPGLLADVIDGYIKVGDAQGNSSYANLGDSAGALASFEKARALARQGLSTFPLDRGLRRQLSIAVERLGDMTCYLSEGRASDALQLFEESIRIRKDLLNEVGPDPKHLQDLASALARAGNMHWELGTVQEAMQFYQRSMEIRQQLYSQDPENADYRLSMARMARRLGTSHCWLGAFADADRQFSLARPLMLRLHEEQKDDAEIQQELLRLYRSTCLLQSQQSNLLDAELECTESLRLAENLVSKDPQDLRAWEDLWQANQGLAILQLKLEKYDEALDRASRGLNMAQDLVVRSGGTKGMQRQVAISHFEVGQILEEKGDLEPALEKFRQAVKIYEDILLLDPASAHHRGLLAGGCRYVARVQKKRGGDPSLPRPQRILHWEDAKSHLERARGILDELVASGTAELRYTDALAQLPMEIAEAETQIALLSIGPVLTPDPARSIEPVSDNGGD